MKNSSADNESGWGPGSLDTQGGDLVERKQVPTLSDS